MVAPDPSLRPSRWLWGLLTMAALVCAAYAWRAFPAAFPLLDLDLRMDRRAALAAAESLATTRQLGPAGARQAAVFQGDPEAQTFIELEGGGPEAFHDLVRSGQYPAYRWEVRRFTPGTPHEVRLYFGPGGAPVGFEEHLGEDEPGAALAADSALSVALAAAATWDVAPGPEWNALPPAVETRPSGRRDHTFLWERRHDALGEGQFRLRLVVSGDRLTAWRAQVHVPEAFTRRYREIRSANDGLAAGATYAMVLLYGLGGVVAGLVVLARRQRLYAWAATRWGVALAAVVSLATVNFLPLAWAGYDTALPVTTFLLQQVGLVVAGFVGLSLMFSASFLGGENLARAGFGDHPFLWGLFGREAGASPALRCRVLLGMLLTPIFLAYAVGFSALSSDWTGWWSPITPLIEPNLLAMPIPWLAIVTGPLQAAVWEELLFRAVPFGAAALLAQRLGGRTAWLTVAFVVQAVVFSAAHANYPAQPAHARLVELLLPSFLFGALFLRWGLVPAIVLHFEYDLVLFALPLFATPGGALLGSKLAVVAAGLVPLALVAWRRWQAGAWQDLPASARNAAHRTRHDTPERIVQPPGMPEPAGPAAPRRELLAVGGIGVILWLIALVTQPSPPERLDLRREAALAVAREGLTARGVDPGDGWTLTARTVRGGDAAHQFVWETAGQATHDSLLGRALPGQRWEVALRRHEGEVAERAEEWRVVIPARKAPLRIIHRLPEGRAGESLEEEDARALADSVVRATLGADPARLELVAATPAERPARRDWTFVYRDRDAPDLGEGEVRLEVEIGGVEVLDARRRVHVPEAWQRERRAGAVWRFLPAVFATVLVAALWLAGGVSGLLRLSRGTLARRRALAVAILAGLGVIAGAWNSWPATQAGFTTTEPLALQQGLLLAGTAIMLVFMAGASGLLAGLPIPQATAAPRRVAWEAGLAAGLALVGLRAGLRLLARGEAPRLGAPGPLDQVLPWLAPSLEVISQLAVVTAGLTAAAWGLAATRRATGARRSVGLLLLGGLALLASGGSGADTPLLVLAGLAGGVLAVRWFVGRVLTAGATVIPLVAGVLTAVELVAQFTSDPWPGSRPASLAAAPLAAAVTWLLVRSYRNAGGGDGDAFPPPAHPGS